MDNRVDLNQEFAAFGGLEILNDKEQVAKEKISEPQSRPAAKTSGKYAGGFGDDLLKDLKQYKEDAEKTKKKDAKKEQAKKDNKIQMIIIALSAIVLLVVAYFAAFNSGSSDNMADNDIPVRVAPVTTPAKPTQTASRRSRYNSASDPNRRTVNSANQQGRARNVRSTRARTQGYERRDSGM